MSRGEREYDVVVAGGGPAGSAAAAHLAGGGAAVLLCDAALFPRDKICGEYLPPAATAAFEQLGVTTGIAALNPLRPRGMAVISPDGTEVLGSYGAADDLGYAVCRYSLDAVLLGHAGRRGAEVSQKTRVVGFDRLPGGGFRIALAVGGGARTPVRARVLVGADGRNSLVARHLGLRRVERRHRRFAVMAHCRGARLPENHGEMVVTPYGYCGFNRLPGGLANVCLVVDPLRAKAPIPGRAGLRDYFDATLDSFPATRERMRAAVLASPVRALGPIACGATHPISEGALLTGDAAGFFDPFTGEGIQMSLRSGEMAAEVLLPALQKDDLSAAALEPYATLRRAEFRGRLRLDRLLQALLRHPRLTDWTARKLARDPALADRVARVTGDMAGAADLLRPGFVSRLLLA